LDEEFLDEMMGFMFKAVIVSGCALALFPTVAGNFSVLGIRPQTASPGRLYYDPQTGSYWVYVPEEEVNQ